MKNLSRILLSLIFLVSFAQTSVVFASTITTTGAVESGDFVIEPGKIEVRVDPGQTVVRDIAVISRLSKKTNFKLTTEDFVGSQNPQTPVVLLGDDKSPYSFKNNLTPDTENFSLSLGQKITIPVTISVPKDAQPGGYYASVIVSNIPSEDFSKVTAGKTKIITRLGVLFFVRVNGPVKESGALSDFRAEGPSFGFIQKGPITFQMLFKNEGSVHLVPYGSISIKNMLGSKVAQIPIDAYFALPNSLRYREVFWNKELLLGRYTAHLTLHRGYGTEVDEQTIAFWVIPWMYIGYVFLFFCGLAFIFYFLSRKFEFKRKS
jgi:hypothetical protein